MKHWRCLMTLRLTAFMLGLARRAVSFCIAAQRNIQTVCSLSRSFQTIPSSQLPALRWLNLVGLSVPALFSSTRSWRSSAYWIPPKYRIFDPWGRKPVPQFLRAGTPIFLSFLMRPGHLPPNVVSLKFCSSLSLLLINHSWTSLISFSFLLTLKHFDPWSSSHLISSVEENPLPLAKNQKLLLWVLLLLIRFPLLPFL